MRERRESRFPGDQANGCHRKSHEGKGVPVDGASSNKHPFRKGFKRASLFREAMLGLGVVLDFLDGAVLHAERDARLSVKASVESVGVELLKRPGDEALVLAVGLGLIERGSHGGQSSDFVGGSEQERPVGKKARPREAAWRPRTGRREESHQEAAKRRSMGERRPETGRRILSPEAGVRLPVGVLWHRSVSPVPPIRRKSDAAPVLAAGTAGYNSRWQIRGAARPSAVLLSPLA